eukprot:3882113-Pyramimonas_sp.AAC.1
MSMDAMIHCFLHAAALASNPWLARRAAAEEASTPNASTSMEPRRKRSSRTVRSTSRMSFLTDFHLRAYLEVAMVVACSVS